MNAIIFIILCVGLWAGFGSRRFLLAAVQQWRRMPRHTVIALLLAMTAATWYGADKGVVARSRKVATLLTVMSTGELRGETNVVASAIAAAAVQGVLDESDATLASISNAIEWCRAAVPALETEITNTTISWLQGEMPASLDSVNPVARADLMRVVSSSNGVANVYVALSLTPASAPVIQFEGCPISSSNWVEAVVISNSFPVLHPVVTPGGVSSCYVYTVSIPAIMRNMVLLPDRQLTFGGGSSNAPLNVLGGIMMNGLLGVTGTREIAPGLYGEFEGGALVEVHE